MQTIEQLRKKIKQTDAVIIKKLAERQALSQQIGQLKFHEGLEIIDLSQEKKFFQCYEILCEKYKLQYSFIKQIFKIIIAHSRMIQQKMAKDRGL